MIIDVKLCGQTLTLPQSPVVLAEGAVNTVCFKLAPDEEWEGMSIIATFRSVSELGDEVRRDVLVHNHGEVYSIPPEVLRNGFLYMGCTGTAEGGALILTTKTLDRPLRVWTSEKLAEEWANAFTPALAAQFLAALGDVSKLDTASKTNLVAAINECYRKNPTQTRVAAACTTDGSAYVAKGDYLPTVHPGSSGTHVGKGAQLIFVPDTTSTTSSPTLQLNDGVPVPIRRRSSVEKTTDGKFDATLPVAAGSLIRGVPYTMTFCGIYWLLDSAVPYELGHVTPQMFGAKADGMSDDTQAIIDALAASDNVLIPAGRYRITRPIWVQKGKSLRGVGAVTILICDGAGGAERFIMLSATVRFGKMMLQVRNGEAVAEEITVNEESLADVRLPSGHIDTIVDDVIVMYDDADYTDNAVIELSLKNEYGEKGKDGFWGVTIKDVTAYGNGSLGYLLRGYTLGTTEQGKRKYYITGITMERCIAYGCRWSQFLHDSDKDFSNLGETWGIDHITSIRCMHQATERTKGFSFYRHDTNAQLTDCVPWDWHYPEGDFKNRPYWFDSGRLSNDSCEMDINVGSLHGEKFGFIYPNGETKLLHYWDQYAVLKNIGVREIITDSLPLQMPLSDGTNKATCIFFAKNPVILSGTSSKYCFLRFRFVDGRHMSEDVTVFLHPEKPVIHASRWATSHKLGYTMVDGEFRLYMYNLSKYSYVISEAISNTTAGYSGTAVTSEYNKTINTFGLPYEERYLSELPAELTEITDIQAVFVERDKLKSLLPGWSTQDKKPAYTPEEVGAAAKVHGHSYNELADKPEIPVVPSWAMQGEKPSYNATEVGADAVGTAAGAVAAHNAADDAHNDIRLQLKEVADRLNALADTDDETLDQVSEIVAYIKSNKALIDAITTKKVNVSDIVDNLTTSTADKPLSAKQGVALKKLIEEIIVPTKVSQLENDTGYLTSAPVASVNGKTGVVKLNATDVGARPDNWMPTAQNVGAVPVNETVTLVGVDANGVSHTWIIYGKKVM